jgi:hypothetical protein
MIFGVETYYYIWNNAIKPAIPDAAQHTTLEFIPEIWQAERVCKYEVSSAQK